jgi:hypothetical protein
MKGVIRGEVLPETVIYPILTNQHYPFRMNSKSLLVTC